VRRCYIEPNRSGPKPRSKTVTLESAAILYLELLSRRQLNRNMEFLIREASSRDLPHLLRHRRAMFVDIGFLDAAVLDSVDRISEEYFHTALCAGRYRAWLAENRNGSVVAGGGLVIADWPRFPASGTPSALGF